MANCDQNSNEVTQLMFQLKRTSAAGGGSGLYQAGTPVLELLLLC